MVLFIKKIYYAGTAIAQFFQFNISKFNSVCELFTFFNLIVTKVVKRLKNIYERSSVKKIPSHQILQIDYYIIKNIKLCSLQIISILSTNIFIYLSTKLEMGLTNCQRI